jgi:putative NADH-flavin reductase
MARVGVLGASGFVGTAVVAALEGHDVVRMAAPRLATTEREPGRLLATARDHEVVPELAEILNGCDVVINCAGDPDASSLQEAVLFGANALLPCIVLEAAARAGVSRFVHVSSAVVQNDKAVLDASEDLRPFSPYSASKAAAEVALRMRTGHEVSVVRYRPPSVHARGRRVTEMIARIATSPFASVAGDGTRPSPQAQRPNVGAAVAFLATCELVPPQVVVHPSEGVTTGGLMRDLSGDREPRHIPMPLARFGVRLAKLAGGAHRATAANARRLEILWLGQGQEESWLSTAGFVAPMGPEGWKELRT